MSRGGQGVSWRLFAATALLLLVATASTATAKTGPAAGAAGRGSPLLATVDVGLDAGQDLDVGTDVGTDVASVELALEAPRSWTYLADLARFSEDAKWRLEKGVQDLAGGCVGPSARLKTRVRGYKLFVGGNEAVKKSLIPHAARDCDPSRTAGPMRGVFLTTDPLGYVDGPNLYQFALNNPVNFSDPMGLEAGWIRQREQQWSDPNAGRKQEIRLRLGEIDREIGAARGRIARSEFDIAIRTFLLDVDPMYQRDALFALMQESGANVADSTRIVGKFLTPTGFAGDTPYELFHSYLGGQLSGKGQIFDISLEIMLTATGLADAGLGVGGLADDVINVSAHRLGNRVLGSLARNEAVRMASRFPTVASQNARLLDVTARAARITDRIIANRSTYWAQVYHNPGLRSLRFARAFNRRPHVARAIIRGNIMDDVAKQLAVNEDLPFLRYTPRGAYGPDFVNQFLNTAWDVTTHNSWPRHVSRYAAEPYQLLPLIY